MHRKADLTWSEQMSLFNRKVRFRSTIVASLAICLASWTSLKSAVAATITLVVTGQASANEWPIYIAKQKGYFTEVGVTLDTVVASSTASAIQQLAAGSGQIASGGLTDPIRAIDQGAKVALLRIHAQVPPYTLWAKPGIKTFNDLRGKLIIVGGAKDITRIYFDRMVQPNNLKRGDYDLVYAGTTPARFAALQAGAVDAAILLPPMSFRAESAGFSLVGRLSDYVKDLPFTGYVINMQWAKNNKATTLAFLKAYQRGLDWFYQPENRKEAIDILVAETKLAQTDAEKTYEFLQSIKIFSPKGVVNAEAIATLVKAMADEGDLQGSADPARFIDPEIAQMVIQAQ
jgi:NitT/TauT family transport system substrate-binding protein